jgi:hypothetical protein
MPEEAVMREGRFAIRVAPRSDGKVWAVQLVRWDGDRWRFVETRHEVADPDEAMHLANIELRALQERGADSEVPYPSVLGPEGMQEGGIVEGPTEAVVGEDGPEAVTPIDAERAEDMAERMAEAAEEAAEEVAEAVEDTEDARIRRVLEALADFAEAEAEEAEEAAEEAEEAAEEGETAEAAAAATEAAAHAEAAISAEEAAEEIAPRRRGFARLWWGE